MNDMQQAAQKINQKDKQESDRVMQEVDQHNKRAAKILLGHPEVGVWMNDKVATPILSLISTTKKVANDTVGAGVKSAQQTEKNISRTARDIGSTAKDLLGNLLK